MESDGRRSADLGAAVELRDAAHQDRARGDRRVRLPRGQHLHAAAARGRPRRGARARGGGKEGDQAAPARSVQRRIRWAALAKSTIYDLAIDDLFRRSILQMDWKSPNRRS